MIGVIAVIVGTLTYLTIRKIDAEYARAGTVQGKSEPL